MNLPFPPEPEDVKAFIREVRDRLRSTSTSGDDIDWDSLAVWYLSKLPSYLWRHWKISLEKCGYTWQRFLKVIKLHTNDAILWAINGELEWYEFLERVRKTLGRYSLARSSGR